MRELAGLTDAEVITYAKAMIAYADSNQQFGFRKMAYRDLIARLVQIAEGKQ